MSKHKNIIIPSEIKDEKVELEELLAVVGQKAVGLLRLPPKWTPPFVVIPSYKIEEFMIGGQGCRGYIEEIFHVIISNVDPDDGGRVIVRSSACAELLRHRGWLSSIQCNMNIDAISDTIAEVVHSTSQKISQTDVLPGKFAIIIQKYAVPRHLGHLSNERRVTKFASKWLLEVENVTSKAAGKRTLLDCAKFSGVLNTDPLICKDDQSIPVVLLMVASWCNKKNFQCHIEWVYSDHRLYAVQMDFEETAIDHEFVSELQGSREVLPLLKLVHFVDSMLSLKRWGKTESTRIFIESGLTPARIYILEQECVINQLMAGRVDADLNSDLETLCCSPVVFRTEIKSSGIDFEFLSPRSDTISDASAAKKWLVETFRDLQGRGILVENVCVLCHHYIQSKSAVYALADPANPCVHIDSIWGLPDGLLAYPHDTFIYNTAAARLRSKFVRYKPHFLALNDFGNWVKQACLPPRDWRPSLNPREIESVAKQALQVAKHLQSPVNIMFLAGLGSGSSRDLALPWVCIRDLPKKPSYSSPRHYAGKRILVTNEVDLHKAALCLADAKKSSKLAILLQPSPDLLRSATFVDKVSEVAKKYNIPVEIEGSYLSHIYYMLERVGVDVKCTGELHVEKKGRKKFYKLVRDLVPVIIQSKGEVAKTIQVPVEMMMPLIKSKIIEEAFELFFENDPVRIFEEMSDLLEVVIYACKVCGREYENLVEIANQKRLARGGFEGNTMLIQTEYAIGGSASNQPDLMDVDFDESPERASKWLQEVMSSRMPKKRGSKVVLQLSPPDPEVSGKRFTVVLDGANELMITYSKKEVILSVEKRKVAPSKEQLQFDFNR